MQHQKGSISRSALIVGGLVTAIALVVTWGLVGVGQTAPQAAPQGSSVNPFKMSVAASSSVSAKPLRAPVIA